MAPLAYDDLYRKDILRESINVLPIKRVVLYKHGVSYIERQGVVAGGSTLSFNFHQSSLNDVMRSLTIKEQAGNASFQGVRVESSVDPASRLLADQTDMPSIQFPVQDHEQQNKQLSSAYISMQLSKLIGCRVLLRLKRHKKIQGVLNSLVGSCANLLLHSDTFKSVPLEEILSVTVKENGKGEELQRQLRGVMFNSSNKRRLYLDVKGDSTSSCGLQVSYMVPCSVWRVFYRLTISSESTDKARLQAMVVVDNVSEEDWTDVQVSLVRSGKHNMAQSNLYDVKWIHAKPLFTAEQFTQRSAQPQGFRFLPQSSRPLSVPFGAAGFPSSMSGLSSSVFGSAAFGAPSNGYSSFGSSPSSTWASSPASPYSSSGFGSSNFGSSNFGSSLQVPGDLNQQQAELETESAMPAPPRFFEVASADNVEVWASDASSTCRYDVDKPVTLGSGQTTCLTVLDHAISAQVLIQVKYKGFLGREQPGVSSTVTPTVSSSLSIRNMTGQRLERGLVTVYEEQSNATNDLSICGEMILDELEPNQKRIIPLDDEKQVHVDVKKSIQKRIHRLIKCATDDCIEQQDLILKKYRYSINNKKPLTKTVLIEHTSSDDKHQVMTRNRLVSRNGLTSVYRLRCPSGITVWDVEEMTTATKRHRLVDVRKEKLKQWLDAELVSESFCKQVSELQVLAKNQVLNRDLVSKKESELARSKYRETEIVHKLSSLSTVVERVPEELKSLLTRLGEELKTVETEITACMREGRAAVKAQEELTVELVNRFKAAMSTVNFSLWIKPESTKAIPQMQNDPFSLSTMETVLETVNEREDEEWEVLDRKLVHLPFSRPAIVQSMRLPASFDLRSIRNSIQVDIDELSLEMRSCESQQGPVLVRADRPIPTCLSHYYFEMKVENSGDSGIVGIGLVDIDVPISSMPGWYGNSYGYHGDDGKKYHGKHNGQGEVYALSFTSGDVIGCYFDQRQHTVTFTKNGAALAVAFENVLGTFYPAVGLQSNGARLLVNFGQSPFALLNALNPIELLQK
eukprot:GILK01007516.1.p1 GENE.GILK01007516.1~~GILK01007516.1.p1  ORF type:complete len:1088 (-),score=270.66 GILK01007516.1:74-3145(-)